MPEITYYRGDTKPRVVTLKDKETGEAVPIADCTFKMTVDPESAPEDNSANLFTVVGAIVSETDGTVSFGPTAENTNLEPGTYYYDIEMTDAGGFISTIALDKFIIKQDITKP